ncbi:molecular chaperone GrpE [Streptomyces sp. SLBN-118]|uniref:nucleotide exchange factor GrpE n=1 Tax=Streptomyces sp. SLBN-118 TaxID=2768454 RepID=UPI001151192D|nr:nucleotide exchange factor GrpE [Streptomyces sp. SLBN-118]TQK50185.1 molecular chaperone GrpE [Streptomyces sp. SLBN-118]
MNRPDDVHGFPGPPLSIVRDRQIRIPATLPTPARRDRKRTERDGGSPGSRGQRLAADQSPPRGSGLREELRERTADLQRLKAEYDNYRKRVRRDRLAVREIAVANVLGRLLPVLDTLAEAAEQGEVTGGFQRVAYALEAELAALGLQSFGAAGDPFDPVVHEAVRSTPSDQVEHPTCTAVLRKGYHVGDHLLRPAQVAVAEPRSVSPPAS